MITEKPPSMSQEWERYVTLCYPNGCNESQRTQFKQAFFAGAFVAFGKMHVISNGVENEDEASKMIEEFFREVKGVCDVMAVASRDRFIKSQGVG